MEKRVKAERVGPSGPRDAKHFSLAVAAVALP